ncbi:MAG: glutamate--tRNA ligase [Candidatus Pacebacteria bacterium]|nr:glutamate--tRNA ligase [Candidatus Paceibacterota bacterium]
MKKIRTRFAPSPTGYLHVGSLRTALYAYLFAKHNDGDFILRIEDTDRSRYVEGSIENLVKILDSMGLEYSEGVFADKDDNIVQKGDFGPYMQSERLNIYKKYIDELIENDHAYYCFCSQDRLDEMRKEQQSQKVAPMYDRKCRGLDKKEIQKLLNEKTSFVVRQKVPKDGFTEFNDLVYGKIKIANKIIDDQVIMKSDGFPTYHLANVVDDHLMEISHIIRGEEWLPSTPKHILLYKAFGWEAPEFAHLPLLLNPDKSKLSKRQGDVAVEDFLYQGYLSEALLNFVLLLGWNPKTEEEIFSFKEMIKRFDLSGVNKAGSIFNTEKLDWINGMYIREMDLSKLTKLCIPYLTETRLIEEIQNSKFKIQNSNKVVDFEYLKKVVALEQERMKKLSEIGGSVKFIFSDKLEYEKDLLVWKKMTVEKAKNNLELTYQKLEDLDEKDFQAEKLQEVLNDLAIKNDIKRGEILWPLRVALTGLKGSPSPFEIGEVLGKEKVLERVKFGIKKMI